MRGKIFTIVLLFHLFTVIFSTNVSNENEKTIMNIYYEKDNYVPKKSKSIDKNAIAYAIYEKSYERVGWDFLSIGSYEKNDSKYKDEDKAYAMGYLEGILTKERIYSYFINMQHYLFYEQNFTIPEKVRDFLKKNIIYMEEKALKYKDNDIYWENVYYIYKQLQGLFDGYKASADPDKQIDFYDFVFIPGLTDSEDAVYYNDTTARPNFANMTYEEMKVFTLLRSHCSALIKLADDYSDIWFGHNTWFSYNSMIRIFKEYRFITNKEDVKSKVVAFPSYPGIFFSQDDFYYLDSNLLVMETTNQVLKESVFNKTTPYALLTWVRAIVANRLASSAEEWTHLFQKENSGTYNNQYMILDLNLIDLKNKTIPEKSFMIIEQIPGEMEITDVTDVLKERGYWPSYNIPYSEKLYNICGYPEILNDTEKIPNYDYNNCSRANIFRREQKNIKNIEDFKNMMRYNDYKNDKESNNEPSLTIACRYDLRSELERQHCYGATDVKFSSVKDLKEGKNNMYLISGPTNVQQPTFSWDNTTCESHNPGRYYHEGTPQTWNFPWIDYKFQLVNIQFDDGENDDGEHDDGSNSLKWLIIAGCILGGIILIIIIFIIVKKCIGNKSSNDIDTKIKDEEMNVRLTD